MQYESTEENFVSEFDGHTTKFNRKHKMFRSIITSEWAFEHSLW